MQVANVMQVINLLTFFYDSCVSLLEIYICTNKLNVYYHAVFYMRYFYDISHYLYQCIFLHVIPLLIEKLQYSDIFCDLSSRGCNIFVYMYFKYLCQM